jgi:hypothetical protein
MLLVIVSLVCWLNMLAILPTGLSHCCCRPELTGSQLPILRFNWNRNSTRNSALNNYYSHKSKSTLCYERQSFYQSVLVSGKQLGNTTRYHYCQTFEDLIVLVTLTDERTDLWLTTAAGPRQRSHSRVRSRTTHDRVLLPQIWGSLSLEG